MRFSLADTNMHSMADKVLHAVLEAAAGLSVILQPSTEFFFIAPGFDIQLSKGVSFCSYHLTLMHKFIM
jgi:hypothetical protein